MTKVGDMEDRPTRRRDTIELRVTPEELELLLAGILVGIERMGPAFADKLATARDVLAYLKSRGPR